MRSVNRYITAFKESYNLISVAVVSAAAMATLDPTPLIVGVIAEAAYLLIVPDTRWYENRLLKRHDASKETERRVSNAKMLATLSPELRDRESFA